MTSTIDNSIHANSGIHCQGCDQRLPLRTSGPAEIAALWECAACSTAFAGVLLPKLAPSLAKLVRLAQLHFDIERTELLPDDFRKVVEALNDKRVNPEFLEQRRSQREVRQLDAVAIGLDSNYMLVGPTCRGLVANLSSHGMLLTTAKRLPSAAVAVQMHAASEKLQLLGNIAWSRPLGEEYYGNGIDFVARLGKVAAERNIPPLSAASSR